MDDKDDQGLGGMTTQWETGAPLIDCSLQLAGLAVPSRRDTVQYSA